MYDSIPINRSILDHWIFDNEKYFKIWFYMLARARYLTEPKTGLYRNVKYTLHYGQFLYGAPAWSKELKVGEQVLKSCVKKLVNDGMLQLVECSHVFSIYEIVNYAKYNHHDNQLNNQLGNQQPSQEQQGVEGSAKNDDNQLGNQLNNQLLTIIQPTTNQLLTTNKESKESRESKEGIENKNISAKELMELAEKVWLYYPKKKGKGDAMKKLPGLIKQFGYEQMLRTVERYNMYLIAQRWGDKYTQLGSTFFNSGYVDYLDKNYGQEGTYGQSGGSSSSNSQESDGAFEDSEEFADVDREGLI